jgi:hypothetical protein
MAFSESQLYQIRIPQYGPLYFKYYKEEDEFRSVDRNEKELKVYIYESAVTEGRETYKAKDPPEQQLKLSASHVRLMRYPVSLVGERNELFKPQSLGASTYGIQIDTSSVLANEMMAIVNDPIAMILYVTSQASVPYLMTMARATEVLTRAQISTGIINIRETQRMMQESVAMEIMIEKARENRIMKWLSSWVFFLIVIIVVLVVLFVCVFFPAAFMFLVAAIALASIGTGLYVRYVTYEEEKEEWEELVEELGYSDASLMPESLKKMYEAGLDSLEFSMYVFIGVLVLNVIVTAVGGNMVNTLAAKLVEQFASEGIVIGINTASAIIIIGIAGSLLYGLIQINSGLNSIIEGKVMKAKANFDAAMKLTQANMEEMAALSKFIKDMVSRMDTALKNLMEAIQEMLKNQSEIVKTLASGSQVIVRNITSV